MNNAKITPAGSFGSEQLYKIVYGQRVHETPLSGKMAGLACRILNGEEDSKVFANESRSYATRVLNVVSDVKST